MIQLEVTYKQNLKLIEIPHVWDIPEEQKVYDAHAITKDDKGKYYVFDDGSNWCSRIFSVSPTVVRTYLCVVRRDDYIHQAKIHYPYTSYSGVKQTEEHHLIRAYTVGERKVSDLIVSGQKDMEVMTPRVKMLTMEKLGNSMVERGLGQDFIIDSLKNAAVKGNEKIKAIKILARILGVELEPNEMGGGKGNTYNNLTIQDQRRQGLLTTERRENMPNINEIKNVVSKVTELIGE